jgi:hypothetical protein
MRNVDQFWIRDGKFLMNDAETAIIIDEECCCDEDSCDPCEEVGTALEISVDIDITGGLFCNFSGTYIAEFLEDAGDECRWLYIQEDPSFSVSVDVFGAVDDVEVYVLVSAAGGLQTWEGTAVLATDVLPGTISCLSLLTAFHVPLAQTSGGSTICTTVNDAVLTAQTV